MVTSSGEVKVVSLGLSHFFLPSERAGRGTARGYAAPELRGGVPTVQSDLFALGRLLYALLIGQLLERRLPHRLPLRQAVPGISGSLVKSIARAAHRSPEERFSSAAQFGKALWNGLPTPVEPPEDWQQRAARRSGAPQVNRTVVREAGPGMADLGFKPDPRFGSEPSTRAVERPPEELARLSVYPREFRLESLKATEAKRVVLSVRNTGKGELAGRVTSHVPWITAPNKAFRLPTSRRAKVVLSVRTALMPSGRTIEPQALSVNTNVGREWIAVTAVVASGPSLVVEQPVLDFGILDSVAERAMPLTLTNAGRQPLTGQVVTRVPWLRVPRSGFRCGPGTSISVPVSVLGDRLPRGPQKAEEALVVDSDGGQEKIEARAWRVMPELDLGTNRIDFGSVLGSETAERHLYVGNTGDGPLDGVARSLLPWLLVHPQRFRCEPGELVQLTATADCTGLTDGTIEMPKALRVQTNGGTRTLSLRVEVRAPRLIVQTSRLDFGAVPLGEMAEQRLSVRNDGSAPLEAVVQCLVPWLTLPKAGIVCEPGEEVSAVVVVDTCEFNRGEALSIPSAVRIIAGSDMVTVPASITVIQPALRVDPVGVDFGYIDRSQPETRRLIVANDGTGKLAWNAQTDALWVEVSPRSGACEAGEESEVTLTVYGLALESEVDMAHATLVINSDGGRVKVPLRVALASPLIATDTASLDLGTSVNMADVVGSFRVFNHGLGLLRGSIATAQAWLAVDRASFECSTGRSVEVRVRTDMEEFPRGATRASQIIKVQSNGGDVEIEATIELELVAYIRAAKAVRLTQPDPTRAPRGRLVIRNSGMATGRAEIHSHVPELVLSRQVCDIKPNKSVRIRVHWEGLLPPQSAQLYIDVCADGQQLQVPVRWEVASKTPTTGSG